MMGALGAFDSESYSQGYNATLSTFMFILGTYVIQVIFMNMLICMMGDTFARVQETSESSSMKEQVNLIKDFEFLVDLEKIFDGKKYIFIVSPQTLTQNQDGTILKQQIRDQNQGHIEKLNSVYKSVINKVNYMESNMQQMLHYHYASLEFINIKLRKLETSMKNSFMKPKKIDPDDLVKVQEEMRFKKQIKAKLSQAQKKGTTANVCVLDIARDYIKLVDKDHNEVIDFEEFKEFCSLIEYKYQNEEQMRAVFEMIDVDKNGTLEILEFAQAIHFYYNEHC